MLSPGRRLASLPAGPASQLALATFIDWSGTGVWLTTSTVLMVRVVHLAPTQVGFGLTAGGLLGLASVWPVTNATRRWPVRRVAMSVQILRGLFALSFLAVHSALTYYLAAALVAVVDRPATSVNQILVSRYVPRDQRTATLAVMHVATNAGMTIGALLASTALVLPSRASLDAVVIANSLSFFVAAWQVRRASAGQGSPEAVSPDDTSPEAKTTTPASRWLTRRFLLVTVGCAALALLFPLLNVEIPLWLTTRTTVPTVTVSVLFIAQHRPRGRLPVKADQVGYRRPHRGTGRRPGRVLRPGLLRGARSLAWPHHVGSRRRIRARGAAADAGRDERRIGRLDTVIRAEPARGHDPLAGLL